MPENTQGMVSEEVQARRTRRRFRKGVFVIPSLLTTANIFCGFFSVMESIAGAQALSLGNIDEAARHFNRAAINIGFSALFDFLDGRIARMTGATSEFGIELDSIADVVSFGIAPAVLAFAWGYGHVPAIHKVAWSVSFLFLICGALRLARFNVQARQPNSNMPPKNPKVDKKAFVGMPIPAGASLIAALAHFSPEPILPGAGYHISLLGRTVEINGTIFAVALIAIVASLGFLMVSTIRYSSFKNAGAGNYHPRVLIVFIALLVLAIWLYSEWSLLLIAGVYALHGVAGKLWSMVKPRRRTLEGPEPELDGKSPSEV